MVSSSEAPVKMLHWSFLQSYLLCDEQNFSLIRADSFQISIRQINFHFFLFMRKPYKSHVCKG